MDSHALLRYVRYLLPCMCMKYVTDMPAHRVVEALGFSVSEHKLELNDHRIFGFAGKVNRRGDRFDFKIRRMFKIDRTPCLDAVAHGQIRTAHNGSEIRFIFLPHAVLVLVFLVTGTMTGKLLLAIISSALSGASMLHIDKTGVASLLVYSAALATYWRDAQAIIRLLTSTAPPTKTI